MYVYINWWNILFIQTNVKYAFDLVHLVIEYIQSNELFIQLHDVNIIGM